MQDLLNAGDMMVQLEGAPFFVSKVSPFWEGRRTMDVAFESGQRRPGKVAGVGRFKP